MNDTRETMPMSATRALGALALQNLTGFLAWTLMVTLAFDLGFRFAYRIESPDVWFTATTVLVLISVTFVQFAEKRIDLLFGAGSVSFGAMLLLESWHEFRFISAVSKVLSLTREAHTLQLTLTAITIVFGFAVVVGGVLTIAKGRVGVPVLLCALVPLILSHCSFWLTLTDPPMDIVGELAIGAALFLSLNYSLFLTNYKNNTDPAYVPGTKVMSAIGAYVPIWQIFLIVLCLWLSLLAIFGVNTYLGHVFGVMSGSIPTAFRFLPRFLSLPIRAGLLVVPALAALCLLDIARALLRRILRRDTR